MYETRNDIAQGATGGVEDRGDIPNGLFGLLLDSAPRQLPASGIKPTLSGEKYPFAHFERG